MTDDERKAQATASMERVKEAARRAVACDALLAPFFDTLQPQETVDVLCLMLAKRVVLTSQPGEAPKNGRVAADNMTQLVDMVILARSQPPAAGPT